MPKKDAYADTEVREFVDALPRTMSYDDMAKACLERFGPKRAWSRSKIARRWLQRDLRRRSRFDQDPALRAFVEARAGRLTLDEILAECRAELGPERTPSRSALGRFVAWLRRHLR